MNPRRIFNVDEANALLPDLQHELELIRESLAVLRKASAALPPGARMDDGASPLSHAALQQLHGAERRLMDLGVELKDVEKGLFDLPAVRDERIVYLCWCEGEPNVAWFHELGTGFTARQPLAGTEVADDDEAEDEAG